LHDTLLQIWVVSAILESGSKPLLFKPHRVKSSRQMPGLGYSVIDHPCDGFGLAGFSSLTPLKLVAQ